MIQFMMFTLMSLIYLVFKLNSFIFFNMFYLDYYSFFLNVLNYLVMMSFFLFILSTFSLNHLFFLFLVMFFMFSSLTVFQLYILFELSLIPIFLIIVFQGKQYERISASLFLFFFTLISSLPLLLGSLILKINFKEDTFSGENFMICSAIGKLNILCCFFYTAFLVKLPVFFFHMWLPKAHVEAPVHGSMVLAGVMLKLGGYGIVKLLFLTYQFWLKIKLMMSSFFYVGMIISGIYCLFLNDLKIIIAVSSVSHMTFFASTLIMTSFESLTGGLMLMIAHGILSPLLFFYINCSYERTKSRSILISKSSFSFFYPLSLFLMCSANFCIPPSLNFFSEILLSISLISFSIFLIFFLFIYMFISTFYSIFIYVFLSTRSFPHFSSKELTLSEFSVYHFFLLLTFLSFMMINKMS